MSPTLTFLLLQRCVCVYIYIFNYCCKASSVPRLPKVFPAFSGRTKDTTKYLHHLLQPTPCLLSPSVLSAMLAATHHVLALSPVMGPFPGHGPTPSLPVPAPLWSSQATEEGRLPWSHTPQGTRIQILTLKELWGIPSVSQRMCVKSTFYTSACNLPLPKNQK